MRWVAGALVVMVTLTGSARAEEIYRWKDAEGRLHFENVPAPNERGTPVETTPVEMAPTGGSDEGAAPMAAASEEPKTAAQADPTYSTDVSTRRSRLERELRGTETRLREIDGRLTTLATARMKNSRGLAATGGVAAPAHDVLSPEEEELVEEREQIAQHAEEVRNDAAELRQEVEARLGAVPGWWTDLR